MPSRSSDLAHAIDLFPTIAAAAGITLPDGLAGINLMDEVARQKRDTVFGVCHSVYNMTPGDPDGTLQYLWCVSREWKLLIRRNGSDTTHFKHVHQWDTPGMRLYHVRDDPHEERDLSADHPEIVADLRRKTEAWHFGLKD